MTTTTVHRIAISDLHTFRLRCRHCQAVSIADVKTWASRGGHAHCMHCGTDWNDSGQAFALVMAGLKTLCASEKPDVFIEAEVVD